jgi:hypothetical protein
MSVLNNEFSVLNNSFSATLVAPAIKCVVCRKYAFMGWERNLPKSSKLVHEATLAVRDAATAVIALGRAVSALSKALQSVADLEARVEVLERAIDSARVEEASVGRVAGRLQAMIGAEIRSHVDTNTAAEMLGRTPQTLRKWACYEDGPLRPVRVNGRLAWAVIDIRRLLNNGRSCD